MNRLVIDYNAFDDHSVIESDRSNIEIPIGVQHWEKRHD